MSAKFVRYQLRFISEGEKPKPGSQIIKDRLTIVKWRRYYVDQRARVRLDPLLTHGQRKEILEACKAFEWRPNRPILVREPIQ